MRESQSFKEHQDHRLRTVSRINHLGVGVGVKALLQPANFILSPDATLNTEINKLSVRIEATNSVNASKRKHKNQINHCDKQRQVLMANSAVCQSKWKPIVEPRRAKPKTYRQASTRWLKFYEEAVIEWIAEFYVFLY